MCAIRLPERPPRILFATDVMGSQRAGPPCSDDCGHLRGAAEINDRAAVFNYNAKRRARKSLRAIRHARRPDPRGNHHIARRRADRSRGAAASVRWGVMGSTFWWPAPARTRTSPSSSAAIMRGLLGEPDRAAIRAAPSPRRSGRATPTADSRLGSEPWEARWAIAAATACQAEIQNSRHHDSRNHHSHARGRAVRVADRHPRRKPQEAPSKLGSHARRHGSSTGSTTCSSTGPPGRL